MGGTKSFSHEQNGSAVTSDLLVRMAVALTSVLLDRMASTHISPPRQNGSALTFDLLTKMAVALTSVLLDRMASTHI